jgi:predicted dehydrogenase
MTRTAPVSGTPVRIGIIGTGFAAHFHLASYAKVYGERFEIVAIAGRNAGARAALAGQHGIPRQYDSADALLADPDIDVVDICVPNALHVPLILAAAQAGKHIICEKPLGGYFGGADAPDDWTADGVPRAAMLGAVLAEVQAVRAAIERAGVTFCYAENWISAPPIVKVDRLMAASGSAILRIVGEESHSGSHGAYAKRWRSAGGGSLLRLGVHPIGAALHLKAAEGLRRDGRAIRPVAVSAQVARLTDIAAFRADRRRHLVDDWVDVEDWGSVTVRFDDGSVAQLTSTDTHMGGIRNMLTAHGSRAQVTANINPNTSCQAFTPDSAYFADEYLVEKTETKEGWSFPAPDEDAVTGYPEELRDFIHAIATGGPPRSGLMLACDVMLVVYAAYLSADERREVDLRPHLQPWGDP